MGTMITFLVGSGISIEAQMPAVGPMTEQVLSGENVIRYAGTFAVVGDSSPVERVAQDDPTLAFVRRLRDIAAEFYGHFGSDHDASYEDIAYVAAQLDDGVMFNYENPALLPLIKQLESRSVALNDSAKCQATPSSTSTASYGRACARGQTGLITSSASPTRARRGRSD